MPMESAVGPGKTGLLPPNTSLEMVRVVNDLGIIITTFD